MFARTFTTPSSASILAVLSVTTLSLAQTPPPTQGITQVPVAVSDSLHEEYNALTKFLGRKQTLSADDRAAVAALLAKVKEEIDAGSKDTVHLAMAAQLAGWVDDAAAQEDAYLRLMDLQPKNEVAMAQWIGVLTRRAQYEDAIEVANSRFPDLATAPRVAVAVATALVAANRFDDALKVLDACAVASMSHADLSPKIIALRQRAMPLFGRWTAEQAVRADEESKAQNARVQFTTSKGTILIELFEQQAPATSLSFVELVENRTYDGTRFHRRLPGFAVLGGDVNTKVGATSRPGFGTIGWRIPDEGKRSDRREAFGGTIGLCKAVDTSPSSPPNGAFVPKSAGSQFFFLLQPAEFLHDDAANFTIFGRIIDGWETVAALGPGDELIAATVVRKGAHEYKSVREPELPKPMEMSVPTQALRAPQPTGVPGQPRPITPR